ncbi:MAG: hypothetical protein FWD86_02665 [Firmicutes bacterium]|nr:hypothetical protein [Bacillota bacterium]
MNGNYTTVLTFKLVGEGPEYEAICKGQGDMARKPHFIRGTGNEKLFDPQGSDQGVPLLSFSEVRISNVFGFVWQKMQNSTPTKDIDIELPGQIGDRILDFHRRNPDKKYRLVLSLNSAVF